MDAVFKELFHMCKYQNYHCPNCWGTEMKISTKKSNKTKLHIFPRIKYWSCNLYSLSFGGGSCKSLQKLFYITFNNCFDCVAKFLCFFPRILCWCGGLPFLSELVYDCLNFLTLLKSVVQTPSPLEDPETYSRPQKIFLLAYAFSKSKGVM